MDIDSKEHEEVVPMDLSELQERLDLIDELITSDQPMAVIVQNRIDKLLSEQSRFKSIFRTSKGSIYFVLQDGTVQRIKLANSVSPVQSPTKNLFFVSKETANRLLERRDYTNVPLVDVQVGVHPLDFGSVEQPEMQYRLTGSELTIHSDIRGNISVHIGNEVTEVIKE